MEEKKHIVKCKMHVPLETVEIVQWVGYLRCTVSSLNPLCFPEHCPE